MVAGIIFMVKFKAIFKKNLCRSIAERFLKVIYFISRKDSNSISPLAAGLENWVKTICGCYENAAAGFLSMVPQPASKFLGEIQRLFSLFGVLLEEER